MVTNFKFLQSPASVGLIILTVLIVVIHCSCDLNMNSEEYCVDYDYSDCNTVEPTSGLLKISFTINKENSSIPFTIYKGKIENNSVYLRDTTKENYLEIDLPINSYYSVKAEYKSGNKKIFAVDGGEISKKSQNICDSICWKVKDARINLELKY